MSIKIGDTIKMKFTNPKTKGVVIGFGFITEKISLADKLNFDENSDFNKVKDEQRNQEVKFKNIEVLFETVRKNVDTLSNICKNVQE